MAEGLGAQRQAPSTPLSQGPCGSNVRPACESGVESRLIEGTAPALTLEHGPLDPGRFATLGARAWTLLVQAVDHHVPDVAALIDKLKNEAKVI